MTRRTITPQELNTLFCSQTFIRKYEASGSDPEKLFRETSDAEFERWLEEGNANKRKIANTPQTPPEKKWWHFWR
jgi:hypothetical protein